MAVTTAAATTGLAHLPGPAPAPILGWRGNMLKFFFDPIPYLMDAYHEYGNVVAFTRGGNKKLIATVDNSPGTVLAFGPACNQAILTQPGVFHTSVMGTMQLDDPPTTRLLSGIFAMNDAKHRQQRRLMMPAFHKKRIEAYRDDMVLYTDRLLNQWQTGTTRNVIQDMMNLTLQISCKSLFGVDTQENSQNVGWEINRWIKMNLNPAIKLKVDVPGSPYRKFTRASEHLNQSIAAVLQQKRESGVDEGDVFSMLLHMRDENGEQMTEDELIGQANIMFFAGHETTATAVTWIMFMLTQFPKLYADVVDEIEGVLHGEAPTVDQLAQLPLLDRVIKETMRIAPPLIYLLRIAVQDTELEGQPVPANSEVFYSPYVTHRMEHIYENPAKFDPDRWLTIDPTAYEYIPFGAGVRMCIGAPFALMEAKIILAMMLQRFRLSLPTAKADFQVVITMAPKNDKNGLMMTLNPPDKQFMKDYTPVHGTVHKLMDLN